jgi:glutamate synthase domain-containing protein 2
MFEIKLSQGAKPGKGGILPGSRVTAEIAAIRGIEEGQDSISPNRHPDINSESDLLDMIVRIRDVTGESLPLVVDKLTEFGLHERIKVIVSGKLITPAKVAWTLCCGAQFVTSARGFMFSLGCIQALHCNKNTCPTGITTHDKRLQKGLNSELKAIRVKQYVKNMVYEVGVIAHSCGVSEPQELRRFHARIVTANGRSMPLDELYPPAHRSS